MTLLSDKNHNNVSRQEYRQQDPSRRELTPEHMIAGKAHFFLPRSPVFR
jgi:hypothetical protein